MQRINDKVKNFLLIILLFTSVDTVLFGTNANSAFLYVSRIYGLIFIAVNLLMNFRRIVKINMQNSIFCLLLMIMLLSAIFNNGQVETIISRVLAILTGFVISKYYEKKEFANVFCNVVYVVSIVAIILEVLIYIMPNLVSSLPTIINTAGVQFKAFFIGSIDLRQSGFYRAGGIFWEPGAFATYINIAFFLELFYCKKRNKKRIAIYSIALFLTLSTTGYIALFTLLLFYALFGGTIESNKIKNSLALLLILAILVTIVFSNSFLYDSLFGKLINKTSTTNVRIAGIIGGFQIAMTNPIVGVFSNNISDMIRKFQPQSGGMLTNTIVYQFAAYGVVFGVLYTLRCFRMFFRKDRNIVLSIGVCVFFVLIFISETFFSFIPYILPFYNLGVENNEDCDY